MKKVTIIGAGALGSHTAMFLRNAASLTVVDYDKVEFKNLASQFHVKQGLGKNKTQALSGTLQLLWGLRVETFPQKLVTNNAEQLLSGADLLIDCLDNGPARRVVQAYAREHKVPCLHGALAANGIFGQVVWDEVFKVDDGGEGAPTCEDENFLPFIAIVSAYLARMAQEFLTTGKKVSLWIPPSGASLKM